MRVKIQWWYGMYDAVSEPLDKIEWGGFMWSCCMGGEFLCFISLKPFYFILIESNRKEAAEGSQEMKESLFSES